LRRCTTPSCADESHVGAGAWVDTKCERTDMFPQQHCKDNAHRWEKKQANKYKFQCGQCKSSVWSLNKRHPSGGCQCGMSRDGYMPVPIRKEKSFESSDLAERRNMKARGTEHAFSLKS
jgi:hypothetical protein